MRILQYAVILVLLSSIALGIIVNPTTTTLNTYTFIPTTFQLNITNNHNFDIFFVNFSQLNNFGLPQISNISANQNYTYTGTISTTAAYVSSLNSLITYFYKTNISVDPITKNVSINATGFQQQNVQVVRGSSVMWTNNDTFSHSVTSTIFDQMLTPGQSFSFTFNTLGNVSYFDRNTNLQGKIEVLDPFSIEYVHSPEYDLRINFSVTSTLVETNMTALLLSGDKYVINYNGKKDGVIKITNIGINQLRNVHFSASQWTLFSQQNFHVNSSQDVFAVFTLAPLITNESETGKNYTIKIDVLSDNALPTSLNLTIEIPSSAQVLLNQSSACDFFKEKKTFCDAFPTSSFCITEPIIKEVQVVKYEAPPLPYNYTQDDIFQLNRKYLSIDDELKKIDSFMKQRIDAIDSATTATKISVEQTYSIIEKLRLENEDRKSSTKTLTTLVIVLIIILALGGIGGYAFYKFYYFSKKQGTMNT